VNGEEQQGSGAAAAAEWDDKVQLDLMQFVARMGLTAPPVMIAVSYCCCPDSVTCFWMVAKSCGVAPHVH
jgi:hypothetical protein